MSNKAGNNFKRKFLSKTDLKYYIRKVKILKFLIRILKKKERKKTDIEEEKLVTGEFCLESK